RPGTFSALHFQHGRCELVGMLLFRLAHYGHVIWRFDCQYHSGDDCAVGHTASVHSLAAPLVPFSSLRPAMQDVYGVVAVQLPALLQKVDFVNYSLMLWLSLICSNDALILYQPSIHYHQWLFQTKAHWWPRLPVLEACRAWSQG